MPDISPTPWIIFEQAAYLHENKKLSATQNGYYDYNDKSDYCTRKQSHLPLFQAPPGQVEGLATYKAWQDREN